MFGCIFLKRKLYDYLEDDLPEAEAAKLKKHVQACPTCQKRMLEISRLLAMAKTKNMPEVSDDFWHDFSIKLDERLNAQLVPELKTKALAKYRPQPVFAFASVMIVFLLASALFYFLHRPVFFSSSEKSLLNDAAVLEELSGEPLLNGSEEDYLDELTFLYSAS
jgi:hypothetical protein